jgi:hypothetical protein
MRVGAGCDTPTAEAGCVRRMVVRVIRVPLGKSHRDHTTIPLKAVVSLRSEQRQEGVACSLESDEEITFFTTKFTRKRSGNYIYAFLQLSS